MIAAALFLADVGWGDHMDDWSTGGWILMMAMMVIFWGLVIVGAVYLVRYLVDSGSNRGGHGRSAIEVLDHRLATGEISPEEYRQRRAMIEGAGSGGDSPS